MGKAAARSKRGCYHCGAADHRARDCPSCTCRLCGRLGHEPPACPLREPPPPDLGDFANTTVRVPEAPATFRYIELFAGIGGFRLALDALGGQCVFASESDRFARKCYAQNYGEQPAGDITTIDASLVPPHDVLTAGFPCQPFSFSGRREGFGDPRGTLFYEIVRLAKAHAPRALLLENVRGFAQHDGGRTLATVVHELGAVGYTVHHTVLDAVTLLPQQRARVFIVGLRRDFVRSREFVFPWLPQLRRSAASILQRTGNHEGALSQSEDDRLALSSSQISKVRRQPYTMRHPEARFLASASSPARTLQSSYGHWMVGSQFVPRSSRQIESGDCCDDSVGWRRLAVRECARLQGFGEDFKFEGQVASRGYNLLGNAVPPPLVAMVAAHMLWCAELPMHRSDPSRGWSRGWQVAQKLLEAAVPRELVQPLRSQVAVALSDRPSLEQDQLSSGTCTNTQCQLLLAIGLGYVLVIRYICRR